MKYLYTLTAILLSVSFTFAKEGMWIPTLLEAVEDDMQAFGCELSAEEIYSINQSSLKDAIVHFNGGCTAEVISSEGLILTNHHCGYSQIQSHSSLENDYLKNGFWAYERNQELANPGVTATFIEEIMDVTQELIAKANDPEAFKKAQEALIEKRIKGTNLDAVIRAFNYGNSYFMIVTKEYKDVRLVGAPPSAVGKFGGDTDNWVWPRHTGDFSMFRIYAGADNEPAEYAESNQPLKAKRHLEINLNGVKEGDFTMVFGFPGRTEQHLLATEVDYVVNSINPMRLEMREASLNIIDNAMRSADKTRIQYAAKQSRISNAYKKWIGQNQGLRELGAVQIKKEEENAFVGLSQAKQDQKSIENLTRMNALVLANQEYQMAREGFIEYFYYGPEIVRFSSRFANLIENYDKLKEKGSLDETIEALIGATNSFFKDYDENVDQAIFEKLTGIYRSRIPSKFHPEQFNTIDQKFKGSAAAYTNAVYKKSVFLNQEFLLSSLEAAKKALPKKLAKKSKKDLTYQLAMQFDAAYWEKVRPTYMSNRGEIDALMKEYVAKKMVLFPNKVFWADANSTLRLTYGKAEGSSPVDGMTYNTFTTADGILQKYIPGHVDFDLPTDLVELLKERDYGIYANEEGDLNVCFTGSNHTTGGNSGSPALNGKGQLIGLNFDRTWESTMSDIKFDPNRCRNIMVDIRYVLFIIDKYAGAKNLIEEMSLVLGDEQPERDLAVPLVE